MRRVLPLWLMLLLFPALSHGQAWSGILSSSRAIDWSQAGLPATLPDGETTPNPWTPPTRTQCTTSACNTVSGGTVTAASINAALSSAPAGTYVLIPAGSFSMSATIQMVSNVTLRGSGAQATILSGTNFTNDSGVAWGVEGMGNIGGETLLTANPSKGATSVTVASTSGLTAGHMAMLQQCMTGTSASNATFVTDGVTCSGTQTDPGGPWVCGGLSQCDRNGSRSEINFNFQTQVFWVPAGGISGTTVNFSSPIESPLWSTSNSAALAWMTGSAVVGAGLEDLTTVGWIPINGTYASWVKGVRMIYTDTDSTLGGYNSHALITNSYFVANNSSSTLNTVNLCQWENDHTGAWSDLLMLNNIWIGGYIEEDCPISGEVLAYNYMAGVQLAGTTYSGEFTHNPAGQVYYLREGNVAAILQDDDTWTAHNFSSWFRNWARGYDEIVGYTNPNPVQMGCFSRFENMVGNVIGDPNNSDSYTNLIGNCLENLDTTLLSEASQLIWGNWMQCTGNSYCEVSGGAFAQNPTSSSLSTWPASQAYANLTSPATSFPASFYMNSMTAHPSGGTGLSWWKTCNSWTTFPTTCASYTTPPMPPIGPDVTGGPKMSGQVYNTPAYIAFQSLPTDPNYSNGIREFDERVYQADGSVTVGPAPPSGLTAVVQ
jgi:Pectate lyase superfamily protein